MAIYKNKKNGQLYVRFHTVLNATNGREDEVMVMYKDMKTGTAYVREEKEFDEKFEIASKW